MTAAFGNSYGYDANGNQTSRTIGGVTYTFTFDYENRLTAISGGSVSATFVYDADGNRIKGTVGGVTTIYVAGLYEYQGGATTHYYEGNALRRTGYGSNNGVFYNLRDHLQSTSVLINQNGTLNSQNYYYPYGGNRGSAFSSLTTKRFTGQYHEAGLPGGEGLSYYNARWYDARLGRFISADTIVPETGNPQALNRFSYVLNNPTLLTDPSGHCPVGYCMLHETNPVGSNGPYIPPSNGQRYFVTNYYGFTIDVSHFEAGMQRGRQIFEDLDRGHPTTAVRDQIRSFPVVGAFGYTSTYAIFRHPTTRAERESVAWGIYLHSQHRFEQWQGSGWLSPGNEWWRGSSYANEDLPSDYLGFYAAARYPHLSSETALKVIARQLGGGMWTSNEPVHARFFGYGHITVPRGTRAVPLYWGDLGLKNYHPTPRVAGASGWYNVAWPASLRISPMGQGTYWGYQHSINTRNGQPWPW